MFRRRENLGLLLGLIGMVMFAGTLPATRLAVGFLDPFFVTAARAAVAGLSASLFLVVMRPRIPPTGTWGSLVVAALCLVLGFPIFAAAALVTVPAAHGGIVLGILPLAIIAAAAMIAGERPSLGFWMTGLAGTALVVLHAWRRGGTGAFATGDLFLIGCVATGAIGYAVSGRLSRIMPGWEVISWACAIAAPVAVLACFALWPADTTQVPMRAWAAVVYLALFAQVIGFFAWNAGVAMGGISRVSQVMFLQTFVIVALAGIVNGEAIEPETLAVALAVVATVMIGRRMKVAAATAPPS